MTRTDAALAQSEDVAFEDAFEDLADPEQAELQAHVLAIIEDDQEIARIQARRAVRIEEARQLVARQNPVDQSSGGPKWSPRQIAEAEIASELSAALRVSDGEAHRLLDTAYGLTHEYSATMEGLRAGLFSHRHAEIIVRFGVGLDAEARSAYEMRMLALALTMTAHQLQNAARATVEDAQATTAAQRHEAAAETRYVVRDDAADGMAYLTLFAPAVEVVAIENYATAIAKSAKNSGDPRTLTQLKADAISDLILNGHSAMPGVSSGIVPRVHVTVPALALLGKSDELAILQGYGPIDPRQAARLVAKAPSFLRVLTDPITGSVLPIGEKRYKPGAVLDELVRLAHQRCRFVNCTKPAGESENDHGEDFAKGGPTVFENLAPLCPRHHHGKHRLRWSVTHDEDGILHWSSPAGFHYSTSPPMQMRPAPRFIVADQPDAPPPF